MISRGDLGLESLFCFVFFREEQEFVFVQGCLWFLTAWVVKVREVGLCRILRARMIVFPSRVKVLTNV